MTRRQAAGLDGQLDSYQAVARNRPRLADEPHNDRARWMSFAAAAGATLAGATHADAAVEWVIPQSPILVDLVYTNMRAFDLDGVAGNDLEISLRKSPQTFPYYGYRIAGYAKRQGDASLIGGQNVGPLGNFGLRRFSSNETIEASTPTMAGSVIRLSTSHFGGYGASAGLWSFDDTGLAGFVIGSAGSKRAGWIKIRTDSFFNGSINRLAVVEILEWAYQTVPGVSIRAGQTMSDPVLGDYDGNGSVGPEDYAEWKSNYGNAEVPGEGADGNEDGIVNAADYTVWRDNYNPIGNTSLGNAAPEPSTVTLGVLALGAAGIAALRRRSA